MARQPVQRIADALVAEGLAAYRANPAHRRAKLLALTPGGRAVLRTISIEQEAWADVHGAAIGTERLEEARTLLAAIRPLVWMPEEAERAS